MSFNSTALPQKQDIDALRYRLDIIIELLEKLLKFKEVKGGK